MRVSVTERQTYKRCRRKWEYSSYNRQSLSPIINTPALDLGTVIHAVLAQWTDDPSLDPISLYESVSLTHLQSVVTSYTERIGCAPSQAELMPTLEAISLGQHMIANYQTKWRSPLPAGYTLIQNELSLVQPVPGTEHCTCSNQQCTNMCYRCYSLDVLYKCECAEYYDKTDCICLALHELECTFDGVMADANGDLYIIERKTFSRTPNVDELNQNDQFLAYQWALSQVYPGKVVGVAYDGLLKKPAPSGVHKSLDDLFLRRLLLRPQAELDEFGLLLSMELLEMASNPPIYKTVPFMGCQKWECSYMQVCQAQSRGEPTDDLLKMFTRSDRKKHLDVES
jgi:hypothetical protein